MSKCIFRMLENGRFSVLKTSQLRAISEYLIILYIAIIATGLWIVYKNRRTMLFLLTLIIALLIFRTTRLISNKNHFFLIVHNTHNKTALSFVHQNKRITIADSSIVQYINKTSSNMNIAYGIENTVFFPLTTNKQIRDTIIEGIKIHSFMGANLLLQTKNKRIIVLRDPLILKHKCIKIQETDIIILNQANTEPFKYFTTKDIICNQDILFTKNHSQKVKKTYKQVNFIEKVTPIKIDL